MRGRRMGRPMKKFMCTNNKSDSIKRVALRFSSFLSSFPYLLSVFVLPVNLLLLSLCLASRCPQPDSARTFLNLLDSGWKISPPLPPFPFSNEKAKEAILIDETPQLSLNNETLKKETPKP